MSSKHKTPQITVAAYSPSQIPEVYFPTRGLVRRSCLLCIHYTARRDLRQDKRCIVPLEKGSCRLDHTPESCSSYERLPELRARNMTPLERVYHRMYTRKQLRRLLAQYYRTLCLTPAGLSELLFVTIGLTFYAQSPPKKSNSGHIG